MRAGYLGPEGTFTQEALLRLPLPEGAELVPLATIHDAVRAVGDRQVDRALLPIENSLEGSVNATLDALATGSDRVIILGELVHPIRHCLIARRPIGLQEIEAVVSHPQASGQCASFLRDRLPRARVLAETSTAAAVRAVVGGDRPWAAIGNHLAVECYGGSVLEEGIEDVPGNETRFVWLGPAGEAAGLPGGGAAAAAPSSRGRVAEGLPGGGKVAEGSLPRGGEVAEGSPPGSGHVADTPLPAGGSPTPAAGSPAAWKTAIVFWGVGAEAPGWLVSCLSEFARRKVNLTRIESRPRRQGLGRYMFFADLEGHAQDPHVAESLRELRRHVDVLRVLGSFPAAGG